MDRTTTTETNMAVHQSASRGPSTDRATAKVTMTIKQNQYMSDNFMFAAGSVLFRKCPITDALQLCILLHRKSGTWILPKGRKDCGETMETAAIRETFEETGYLGEFLPCHMATRAPLPGVNTHPRVVTYADGLTEPFAVTTRGLGRNGGIKIISWYITRVKDPSADKALGTQTTSEDYESFFFDIDKALSLISPSYRDVTAKAVEIVQGSNLQF